MSNREFKISYYAEEDLIRIKTFLTFEFESPGYAKKMINKIMTAFSTISEFPEIGRNYEDDEEMKIYFVEWYAIFYYLFDEYIEIYRIYDTKEDYVAEMLNQ
jgi:plasmid stabilization system protein ParE